MDISEIDISDIEISELDELDELGELDELDVLDIDYNEMSSNSTDLEQSIIDSEDTMDIDDNKSYIPKNPVDSIISDVIDVIKPYTDNMNINRDASLALMGLFGVTSALYLNNKQSTEFLISGSMFYLSTILYDKIKSDNSMDKRVNYVLYGMILVYVSIAIIRFEIYSLNFDSIMVIMIFLVVLLLYLMSKGCINTIHDIDNDDNTNIDNINKREKCLFSMNYLKYFSDSTLFITVIMSLLYMMSDDNTVSNVIDSTSVVSNDNGSFNNSIMADINRYGTSNFINTNLVNSLILS
jgi:hypothetical protein